MLLDQRVELLVRLGNFLDRENDFLNALIQRTHYHNPWFTPDNQERALHAIREAFLSREKLEEWLQAYSITEPETPRRVGLVLAGNIPLVGFHDLLTVFVSGHRAMVKLSSQDPYILPYLIEELKKMNPAAGDYFSFVDKLSEPEAVIATGSNNSARYFQAYFGKYPHIIRRNRNAVAVLSEQESEEDLHKLGEDIFAYFGLGCRNVSKLYVPQDYDFTPLLEALHEYRRIVLHPKYKNNFDYNYALYSINREPFFNNGCIILAEADSLQSRIGVLHYEFYDDTAKLAAELVARADDIQCVVGEMEDAVLPSLVPFGEAQQPGLGDYADGVDTLAFLSDLK